MQIHCDGSITNIGSLMGFITNLHLPRRKAKKKVCSSNQNPYLVWKCFNIHLMLIATTSYSKFESNIQLQREESAVNLMKVERCFIFCKCWGHWHCHLLTDSLQSVFSIKRLWPKWNCTEFFPSRLDLDKTLKKDFNRLVPKLVWVPKRDSYLCAEIAISARI